MAQYKVIQDIEAEDKLVGPLTLRQFVYAGVAGLCLYLSFLCIVKGAAFLLILWGPIAAFCIFFAFPWTHEQSTEVWALARIGFMFKPRKRVWNQSGIKELVTITAPKREVKNYTNGLTETEVKSRLNALANTIDSRGWAIKNVSVNLFTQPNWGAQQAASSDRLLDLSTLPREVSNLDITPGDDMLDERNNRIAQQFDQMISASSQTHRQQIVQQLKAQQEQGATAPPAAGETPADYWFLSQPTNAATVPRDNVVFADSQVVLPGQADTNPVQASFESADEAALGMELKQRHQAGRPSQSHLKTIQPLGTPPAAKTGKDHAPAQAQASVTRTPDPAILDLANNDDQTVANLAREAKRRKQPPADDEVVISLH
jgi:hypothetical protein